MQSFFTTTGRALLMGLGWALVWVPISVVAGSAIVGEVEPEHIGGALYPSLICGALFSAIAGIASGRQRVQDLSLSQIAGWSAVTGALVSVLLFASGTNDVDRFLWTTTGVALLMVFGCSVVAGIVTARRTNDFLRSFRAATLIAIAAGVILGAVPWMADGHGGSLMLRFAPVAVTGAIAAFTALSAYVSRILSTNENGYSATTTPQKVQRMNHSESR